MTDTTTAPAPPARPRHFPVQVAPETFVIQATQGEGVAPSAVHMNSMVIRGREPVVVDTGLPVDRETYLEDLFSIVEPQDVRWVFLSHDDVDHYGNLHAVMAACPDATLVTNWFLTERLMGEPLEVPPTRWRWVADGESFDAGDRTLLAVRPPLYDSPTTRGLFDPTTGVYWASDCFATPVPRGTAWVEELDPDEWAGGFTAFQAWNSPWLSLVDPRRFAAECSRLEALRPQVVATCHGPTVGPGQVGRAFDLLRAMPSMPVPPMPDQMLLDQIVAGIMAGTPGTPGAPAAPGTPGGPAAG